MNKALNPAKTNNHDIIASVPINAKPLELLQLIKNKVLRIAYKAIKEIGPTLSMYPNHIIRQ